MTGQKLATNIGIARQLSFGHLKIRNVAIAYADAPPFRALELDDRPALLLGMRELRTFKRVAIDFASQSVLFDVPDDL